MKINHDKSTHSTPTERQDQSKTEKQQNKPQFLPCVLGIWGS